MKSLIIVQYYNKQYYCLQKQIRNCSTITMKRIKYNLVNYKIINTTLGFVGFTILLLFPVERERGILLCTKVYTIIIFSGTSRRNKNNSRLIIN